MQAIVCLSPGRTGCQKGPAFAPEGHLFSIYGLELDHLQESLLEPVESSVLSPPALIACLEHGSNDSIAELMAPSFARALELKTLGTISDPAEVPHPSISKPYPSHSTLVSWPLGSFRES